MTSFPTVFVDLLSRPVRRATNRRSLALALTLLLSLSLALTASVRAAGTYSVSVPVTLKPYDADRWALLNATDFATARAIDPSLPDPFALPSEVQADPSRVREEAFVGPAAKPYRFIGATAQDRSRALYCLTAAIYYEAASESDDGQRGVAQVVLNRTRHPSFPGSVCGVVFQGSDRTTGCQFSFACDGSMARRPSAAAWARASRAAGQALGGRTFASVGLATHYHTQAIWPRWGKSLVMTNVVGAHIFHRWRGRWGESAAFSQPYAGIEPVPGPYRPVALQLARVATPTDAPDSGAAPIAALPASVGGPVAASAAAPSAAAPVRATIPDFTRGASARPLPAPAERPATQYRDRGLAQSGEIKDAYKSSGEWIAR